MKHLMLVSAVALLLVSSFARAQEDKPQVVATFSILGDVIQNVGGEAVSVEVLMPVGTDPHTFQPTPQDVARLIEADMVFSNGIFFEESLLDVMVANADDINEVMVSPCIPIIGADSHDHEHAEGEEHEHAEGEEHEHAEGEEHEHAEGEEHKHEVDLEARQAADLSDYAQLCEDHSAEILETVEHFPHYYEASMGQFYAIECEPHEHGEGEEHDHGACDPHVWTDPHNVFWWVLVIRDHLIQLDPENAQTYADNAAAYILELDETAHDLAHPLREIPAERKILITNHNTFGYLAAWLEFEAVEAIIPGGSTTAEPSAGEFADLIRLVEEKAAPALFAENTVSSTLVDQLSAETGVPVYLLYTDSLTSSEGEAATYLDYLRYNLQTLLEALAE